MKSSLAAFTVAGLVTLVPAVQSTEITAEDRVHSSPQILSQNPAPEKPPQDMQGNDDMISNSRRKFNVSSADLNTRQKRRAEERGQVFTIEF